MSPRRGAHYVLTTWHNLRSSRLFALRLGKPLTGGNTDARTGIFYRVFERGLDVVNPDTVNDKVLTPSPPIEASVFFDVFSDTATKALLVPKYSGRVFLLGGIREYGVGRVTP